MSRSLPLHLSSVIDSSGVSFSDNTVMSQPFYKVPDSVVELIPQQPVVAAWKGEAQFIVRQKSANSCGAVSGHRLVDTLDECTQGPTVAYVGVQVQRPGSNAAMFTQEEVCSHVITSIQGIALEPMTLSDFAVHSDFATAFPDFHAIPLNTAVEPVVESDVLVLPVASIVNPQSAVETAVPFDSQGHTACLSTVDCSQVELMCLVDTGTQSEPVPWDWTQDARMQ